VVGGGYGNTSSGQNATIGGGAGNIASNWDATVSGGLGNIASGSGAFVGGGGSDGTNFGGNQAQGNASTIGGGISNTVTSGGNYATIGGGQQNKASYLYTTVSGGFSNIASGDRAMVGGGEGNIASGSGAMVGGGYGNTASGWTAFVGGGGSDGTNYLGNQAQGNASTIPGGMDNVASGNYSFAAGYGSNAVHNGTFVWTCADCNPTQSTAPDQFLVSASGGVTMYTSNDLSAGVQVLPGSGTWSSLSDRNAKANFADVNSQDILARVVSMPIQTWNYKTQDASIRHLGPMAQDFYAAFKVGEDDTHITTIDSEGVALAAIQGLYQVVQEKDAKIAAQQKQIDSLEARVTALEQTVGAVKSPTTDLLNNGWMLGAVLVGILWVSRQRRGGER